MTQGTSQALRAPAQSRQSTFVTVVAWIFIVIAGFATVIGVIQNIMIYTLFPAGEINNMLTHMTGAAKLPAIAMSFFAHMRCFMFGLLLASVFTLVSAIGLLKRMNWARIVFIVFMSLGLSWEVLGIVWEFVFTSSASAAAVYPESRIMHAVITVFGLLVALGFAALYGWIIKKLVSKDVKAEFGA